MGIETIAPGADHVPGWLPVERQAFLVDEFRRWAAGPVPPAAPKVRGHEMSVRTVCLGWHWQPYRYTREATNVNGERVLPMPDWLVALGQEAMRAVGDQRGRRTNPTPLWSTTTTTPQRWGCTKTRTRVPRRRSFPSRSATPVFSGSATPRTATGRTSTSRLASGDLFVFGGAARLAYHGVTRILPGTAPGRLWARVRSDQRDAAGHRARLSVRRPELRNCRRPALTSGG